MPDPVPDERPVPRAPQPGAESLSEPLRSRWSPSVFDPEHRLSRDELETLLHAAQWAPSEGNSQPWSFVVAERGSASHAVLVRHLSRGNAGWVPRASAVLVTVTQVTPDADGNGGGRTTQYDLGQAAAHLTLQARAMGLHAHQFSGFDRDAVQADLAVPDHHRVMTGIAIGVPGDPGAVDERTRGRERKPRRRKPLAELAYGDAWGEAWTAADGGEQADRPRVVP
jgi:nitroreductase